MTPRRMVVPPIDKTTQSQGPVVWKRTRSCRENTVSHTDTRVSEVCCFRAVGGGTESVLVSVLCVCVCVCVCVPDLRHQTNARTHKHTHFEIPVEG